MSNGQWELFSPDLWTTGASATLYGSDRRLERTARTFVQGLQTSLRDSAPLWNAMHMPGTTQSLIDNTMMNLGDPRGHCDVACKQDAALFDHVRLNGSSFHVVEYNAMTVDGQADYRVGV